MSLADKLAAERRGRLAAERLLELKQAELYAANRKLGQHAQALTEEIGKTRKQVATIRDENRRVKSDLSVATENLKIAERRLWQAISTIQDGFAFFDADDTLIAANQAYMAVFDGIAEVQPGIAYARILQLLTEEGIIDPGDVSPAEWRADMLQRRQQDVPEPSVIRLWNDQHVKMIEHRGPTGDLVTLGINITESVIYERELKDARNRAETAARAKSAFLANMSHEIRTPMNGVIGMAELLQDGSLDEDQQLYVNTIRNSGEALLVIINDILDYSKMEAEKLSLHLGEFDLEQSIHEVLMLLQSAAREKNVSILLDYDMLLPGVFVGDMGRIRQILTNLIGNAVKFTLEGHVLIRVIGVVDEAEQHCDLHITVEDTGIGIDPEKVEHIFSEFTQVEDERNRQFEGTGLGLAISKRLVALMGGEIWVTSDLGVGSCFGFKIRLALGEVATATAPKLEGQLKRVMIVDDSGTHQDILQRQLMSVSISADLFCEPEAALSAVNDQFDLVIVDQDLPQMNGQTFVKELRARGSELPVIVLNSNPNGLSAEDYGPGVYALLPRPAVRTALFEALKSVEDASVQPARIEQPQELPERSDEPEEPPLVFRPRSRVRSPDPSDQEPSVQEELETDHNIPDEPPEEDTEPENPSPDSSEIPVPVEVNPPADIAEATFQTEPQSTEIAEPAPPDPPAPPEPAQSTTPPQPKTDLRQMRILAAEDNKTNQLVFRKLMKTLDIELKFANNGLEAVAAVEEFDPDLVFMDISMPKMDGKEATQEIRKREAGSDKHLPIMALTAHAMTGDDEMILAAGLDGYLTKPFRKPEILAKIKEHTPQEARDPFAA